MCCKVKQRFLYLAEADCLRYADGPAQPSKMRKQAQYTSLAATGREDAGLEKNYTADRQAGLLDDELPQKGAPEWKVYLEARKHRMDTGKLPERR